MKHKHIQVIIEAHDYAGEYDTWDVINDIIDYIENPQNHNDNCITNSEDIVIDQNKGYVEDELNDGANGLR